MSGVGLGGLGLGLGYCIITPIAVYIRLGLRFVALSLSQASVIHCTVRVWDTLSSKGKCLNGR